jgi:hypothetical protein
VDLGYKRFLDEKNGIQFDEAESPGVYINIRKVGCYLGLDVDAKMSKALYHRMT